MHRFPLSNEAMFSDEPIHEFFGLSYASYLVLPRSILQSMPQPWQEKLVDLLLTMESAIDLSKLPAEYVVMIRDLSTGKFKSAAKNDPFCEYDRGRRTIHWTHSYRKLRAEEMAKHLEQELADCRRLATEECVDRMLHEYEVAGELNHLRNWIGLVAWALQNDLRLTMQGMFKLGRTVDRIHTLRTDNCYVEIF